MLNLVAASVKQPNPHTHIHARVPAGSSHPLDTHQRNKVQLRCLNSARVFSQKWDNRAAHIHTVHRLVHTYVCTIQFFHGGADPACTLDSPSTWRHVFFVVYAFISLLSWTLWTRCPPPSPSTPPPGPPGNTVVQPHSYPLPTKAGKYSRALTRDMRKKKQSK